MSRVGFLSGSDVAPSASILRAAQAAAAAAGLQLVPVDARNLQDFESAFATLAKERAQALMVSTVFNAQRQRLVELSLRARLPTISPTQEFVEAGGLMSYGVSTRDFNRRAAFYVDKIIKGAKPGDLPVQQPTRFFLTINRKTADALGLTIPLELLVQSDEIVE